MLNKRSSQVSASFFIMILVFLCIPSSTKAQLSDDFLTSVCKIIIYDKAYSDILGYGSGFFISPDGFLFTNHHVVQDYLEDPENYKLMVQVFASRAATEYTIYYAQVIAYDHVLDSALLSITSVRKNAHGTLFQEGEQVDIPEFNYLSLGNSDSPEVTLAQELFTLGYPFQPQSWLHIPISYSHGRIQTFLDQQGLTYIVSTAVLDEGNSGGPSIITINDHYYVIGMNSIVWRSETQVDVRRTLSLPINYAYGIIPESNLEYLQSLHPLMGSPKILESRLPDPYEPDDTTELAKPISTDGAFSIRTIHTVTDTDYITFHGEQNKNYLLQTHGQLDTTLELYNVDGTCLAVDDDSGEDYNALLVFSPDNSMDYYIKVKPYLATEQEEELRGIYKISVMELELQGGDNFEPDNNGVSATELEINALGQEHSLEPEYDIDFFTFHATANTTYELITSCDADIFMELFNADFIKIGENDDAAASQTGESFCPAMVFQPEETGTFYIKIRGYKYGMTGNYTIQISEFSLDDYEPNNSFETATSLPMGQLIQANFLPAGDADFFALRIEQTEQVYLLETKGEQDTVITLYNGKFEMIGEDDDSGINQNGLLTFQPEQRGTYYVRVIEYDNDDYGTYALHCQAVQEDPFEPNNTLQTAHAIRTSGTPLAFSLFPKADSEFFTFRGTRGVNYHIETITPIDTKLIIMDNHGNVLAEDDDSGENQASKLSFIPTETGTYFIHIFGYDGHIIGPYNLVVDQPDSGDRFEPDNLKMDATLISEGAVLGEHTILPEGDVDYYRMELDTSHTVRMETLCSVDTVLEVQDEYGNVLSQSDDINSDNHCSELTFKPPVTGFYYILVRGYDMNSTGTYQLIIERE